MERDISWTGTSRVKGWTEWQRMALLTFALIGLQFTWGVEITYFTPHLLQLGLAKSQTSLVWIAPPLSGLLVQPIVGTISDHSTLRWGRRRPYMLVCSILVALFLCILAWSSEIAGLFAWKESMAKPFAVSLAVFCIYAVDFAINALQATARSLIVDTLPESQQQLGSAWAGRMLGFGHVLGYFAGTIDLMNYFGKRLGDSQFKQICVIASVALISCTTITCLCVAERVLVSSAYGVVKSTGFILADAFSSSERSRSAIWRLLSTILSTMLHLPARIKAVCWITFWSWIGWSPFFVYGTTWVGETYFRQTPKHAHELKGSKDVVGDIARKGSSALALFSAIAFTGSVFLPWIVESPEGNDPQHDEPAPKSRSRFRPDITTAWATSQMAFAGAMILTPISRSFLFATIVIAFCGLPWAMYGWAPLAIMGEEINSLEQLSSDNPAYRPLSPTDEQELTTSDSSGSLPITSPASMNARIDNDLSTAGLYLGIWNIFAAIPQFLATFIAWVAFAILEPGKSPELAGDGDGSVKTPVRGLSGTAVCLAIGAACSFIAGLRTFRLRRVRK